MRSDELEQLRTDVARMLALLEGEANPYVLLALPQTADEGAIKAAFRTLARIYHSDGYPAGVLDPALSRDMLRVMAGLSRAQTQLLTPAQRAEVDARISLQERGVPTDVRVIFAADEAFRSGKRLLERSAFGEARDKLREAANMNPAESEFQVYLLWAEYCVLAAKGGPLAEAEMARCAKRLEELAQREESRNDAAWTFVGNIARNQGDDAKAYQAYHAAQRANPDNLEAQSNLRLLQKRASSKKASGGGFFSKLFGRK